MTPQQKVGQGQIAPKPPPVATKPPAKKTAGASLPKYPLWDKYWGTGP
jgi:hypothetical protein